MQALSTMNQTDRLKVLEYLYEMLCYFEGWDKELSNCGVELDKYNREKKSIRKKHKNYFFVYMYIIDTFIIGAVMSLKRAVSSNADFFAIAKPLAILILFVILLAVGYLVMKKADRKSCSDVLLTEYLAEATMHCYSTRGKIAVEIRAFMDKYAVPDDLTTTSAVDYVYDLLYRYPKMSLYKAIENYNASQRERREREERIALSQQLERIRIEQNIQHREKMDIARKIAMENRRIANGIDDIRYATGSYY